MLEFSKIMEQTKYRQGFTLIELLVVVSIISLLSSVVLASLNDARHKAKVAAGKQFSSSLHNAIGLGLVGEWKFEQPGLIAYDTSGYGNNGGLAGGATQVSASVCGLGLGGCAEFDGVDDYVNIADSGPEWDFSIFTASAWVKPDDVTTTRYVMGDGNQFRFYISSGKWKVWMRDGSATSHTVTGNTAQVGEWVHIVQVFDGSNLIIYENGVEVDRNSGITGVNNGNNLQAIGAAWVNSANKFDGLIDEVRIYSSALTAQEVGKIYAEGRISHPLARVIK
jgi:prepilin-type N-terminal cleavage/methylation domain-containing protein